MRRKFRTGRSAELEGLAGWGRERVGYWVEGHVAGVDHCCYDLEGVRVGGV